MEEEIIQMSAGISRDYKRFAIFDAYEAVIWAGKLPQPPPSCAPRYDMAFQSTLEKVIWLAKKVGGCKALHVSVAAPTRGNHSLIPASIFRQCKSNEMELVVHYGAQIVEDKLRSDWGWKEYFDKHKK